MKTIYKFLGFLFLFLAYIGILLPGVPTTFFVILSAWAFSKSSPKFHEFLRSHPILGKHLKNWETMRIYPREGKILMLLFQILSLSYSFIFLPLKVTILMGMAFLLILIFSFQFPEDRWEWKLNQDRKLNKP